MRLAPLLWLAACAPVEVAQRTDDVTWTSSTGSIADATLPTTPACDWTYEEQDTEDALAELPAVGDALAQVLGRRSAVLTWIGSEETTGLTFELAEPGSTLVGTPTVEGCDPHLLVDVSLAIATDDGALDELLEITVRAEDRGVVVEHWFPYQAMSGGWAPYVDDGSELVDVGIEAVVEPGAMGGSLLISVLHAGDDDGYTLDAFEAARW